MTDVLSGVFVDFLAAREQAVRRSTFDRDRRVIEEVRAALDMVASAGGGVARLDDRRESVTRMPWEGPFTRFDKELLTAALKLVCGRARAGDINERTIPIADIERTLRQLGRRLSGWKAGGIDALGMGMLLAQNPSVDIWSERAPYPPPIHHSPHARRLRLVASHRRDAVAPPDIASNAADPGRGSSA